MAQHLKPRKSAYKDLFILFDHFNGTDSHSPEEVSKAIEGITDKYRLDGAELRIVVHLARNLPKGLSYKKIPKVLGPENSVPVLSLVKTLLRKNFICLDLTSSGMALIKLSTEAICAFNWYRRMGSLPEMDWNGHGATSPCCTAPAIGESPTL